MPIYILHRCIMWGIRGGIIYDRIGHLECRGGTDLSNLGDWLTDYKVAERGKGIVNVDDLFKPGARRPAVGARLVSWNCFPISVCVCMYICLSFRTHVSKTFTWSLKAACIQSIKAKESYTHAQVSSPSKACFFPNRKPGVATIRRLLSQLS